MFFFLIIFFIINLSVLFAIIYSFSTDFSNPFSQPHTLPPISGGKICCSGSQWAGQQDHIFYDLDVFIVLIWMGLVIALLIVSVLTVQDTITHYTHSITKSRNKTERNDLQTRNLMWLMFIGTIYKLTQPINLQCWWKFIYYCAVSEISNVLGSSFPTEAVRKLDAFTGKQPGALGGYTMRSRKFNNLLVV